MFRLLIPLTSAILLLSSSSVIINNPEAEFFENTVNAVLGDKSFEMKFGHSPDAKTSEKDRIQTHLYYVIDLLESEKTDHLNKKQVQNRNEIIQLLKDYTEAGHFPKNHYFENRRPVFIDRDGNLCAVGYLIAKTEGLKTAQKINNKHKFDYINDIDGALIDKWLTENGLSKKEAAMIQPMYGSGTSKKTITNNNIELEYAIGSSLLAGAQISTTVYSKLSSTSIQNTRRISAINTAMGLTSLTLGIINVDNSYTEVRVVEDVPIICMICYDRYETTYKNPARTKFSIANIVIGAASATFNGIRFFRAQQREESSGFNVSATQVFDPSSGQAAPALSFSYSF